MTPLEHALALARGGQAALEAHRARLNDLNVYPVPDGDTGSNLADTAARLTQGLEALDGRQQRHEIARASTRAALMGARGNSGVILSQIVRGFAEALGAERGQVDAAVLARALRSASDAAYGAVRQPVEGTMLTAIRSMAERAEGLPPATPLEPALESVLAAGDEAVAGTTAMLPVLRQAGVVDAGAAGLVEYVRGAVAGMSARPPLPAPSLEAPLALDAIHLEPGPYRYCTTFLIEGDDVDRDRVESLLEPLGDSLLVVGESPVYKVHLHTDDPGAALSIGVAAGSVGGVEVADTRAQTRQRTLRLLAGGEHPRPATALVAVAAGDGVARAFHRAEPAVVLVEGGQSANPSAGEIAAAVAAAEGAGVLVLPNNRNAVLAAEHASVLGELPARVVPSVSPAAGLVLAELFDPGRALEQNAERLAELNARLRTGEVAPATRDATVDGVSVVAGQQLAVVEDTVIGAFDDAAAAASAVAAALAPGTGLLTVLVGDGIDPGDESWLAAARSAEPAMDVRLVEGGQPVYPLMACAGPAAAAAPRRRARKLTAETTALVLDSTADVADPGDRHANWSMVPLTVSFGSESFRDYVDIGPAEFYGRLRTAPEPPRTAAPSPGAWQDAFERLDGYDRVLVLPVSSRVSASAQSAELAARALDPDAHRITVLDSASVSVGTLLLADGLQRLLVRGLPENELMLWFEHARERLGVVFSVDTLEYLRRGGRIGRAQALVGGVLGVRPIMTLLDGEVEPVRRVRGRARARRAFERFLLDHAAGGGKVHTAIVHADAAGEAQRLADMVRAAVPGASIDHVGELGAVVGTHGGPGTLGLAVLTEP